MKEIMIEFDDVVIDAQNHRVLKADQPLDLEPKSFRVLLHLVENRTRVVPKEELLNTIWSGSFVSENALTRVVAQLRKALGDDARQARYIETVPTVGYRFIADVKADGTSGDPQPSPQPTPVASGDSPHPLAAEPYTPRPINWWIPLGAISAIILAYFMPVLREWTRTPGSGNVRTFQFTTSTGLDTNPSFSPDASSLVFASDRSGHFELYVKQVAPGGAELQITRDGKENLEPAWSPDGSSIAYTSVLGEGIYVVPALGGMPRKLTSFGSQPVWTADSRRILFRSQGILSLALPEAFPTVPTTLWIVNADGGEPQPLTQPNQPPSRHSEPATSPDGRHVVFLSSGPVSGAALWELDLQTRSTSRIDLPFPAVMNPTYARDGASLYFIASAEPDHIAIYRLSRDPSSRKPSGPPEILHRSDLNLVRNAVFTPDGRRFAFSVQTMQSNLWQRFQNGQTRAITSETAYRITQPVYSPDGEWIAYTHRRKGIWGDIWAIGKDGDNPIQITRNPSPDYMPSWTPDGRAIVYGSTRNGIPKLMQFSLKDGSEKEFASLGESKAAARLSPDGRTLVFNRNVDGVIETWTQDIATGRQSRIAAAKEGIGFATWSPDSKWLALQEREGPNTHIVLTPSGGGPIRRITNRPGHAWSYSFSPDGKKLSAAATWDGVWNLYTVDIATGAAEQLTRNTLLRTFVRYPAWSPKGDPITYEQNETRGNIFLAELP
jgi:Tol biopolymer transport system component/DNA-binding winged helix-turn-helix (wHTH) protein